MQGPSHASTHTSQGHHVDQGATDHRITFLGGTQNKKGVAHKPGTGEDNLVISGIFFFKEWTSLFLVLAMCI